MPEQWLSVAEAATLMGVHPRTVERRAAAGKMESRRNDDGQVQVYVPMPPASQMNETISAEVFETVREMADRQVDLAAGGASALVRVAQELAIRADNQLVLARHDVARFRREAQMALALVAVMLLGVVVAVGWCARTITTAQDQAASTSDSAHQAQVTIQAMGDRLDRAIADRAQADGELKAYQNGLAAVVEQTKPKPVTRPVSIFQRLTQAFIGE